MSTREQTHIQSTPLLARSLFSTHIGLLQRRCACDGIPGPDGQCTECRREQLLGPGGLSIQPKLALDQPGNRYEREADQAAEQVLRMPGIQKKQPTILSHIGPTIQRFPKDGAETPAEPVTEAVPDQTPAPGLIVEDSAGELSPGQMRKSEFLSQLRVSVRAAADAALAGTGRSTEDCPYIEYWFGYYGAHDSRHIERAIHRYAPEAWGTTTASEYVSVITARVRRAVEVWAETGRVTGVPKDVPTSVPGSTPASSAEASPREPAGTVLLKARDGVAREAGDPREIQAQLDGGHPLDAAVKSHMEAAFGADFSGVRVHTDARATTLSAQLNARAFTIGSDIAFGAGEYRPGTLIGDALLAHELAHVMQQGGASPTAAPLQQGVTEHNALEDDADRSAVVAIASLWSKAKGSLSRIQQDAMPRLRSGLQLSRCSISNQCPKQNSQTKTLDVFQLAGSSVDAKSEVTSASAIWIQGAGIVLSPTYHKPFDEAETKKLIGTEPKEADLPGKPLPVTDLWVDADTFGARDTQETTNLAAKKAGADAAAFFVPNVVFGGLTDPRNRQVFISRTKCQPGFVLAHELGHFYLGPGHSKDWDSPLMHPEDCRTGIVDLECRIARGDEEAIVEYYRARSRR